MLQHGLIRLGRIHETHLFRSRGIALLFLLHIIEMQRGCGLHLTDACANVFGALHYIFVMYLHPVRRI